MNPLASMGAQVVHHDNLSSVQTRGEELFHIDFKSSAIGRPLQDHGGSHALKRERGDERRILPAIARHPACGALSFGGSRIKGRECDIRATLIHKDQLLCWQWTYCCSPGGALLLVALRGTQRFFCASNRRGEWHDSSSCDPPTCHACFPRAGSGLAACYPGGLAVVRAGQLPRPHISWKDVPEWLWERDLRLLVVVSGSA